MQNKKFDWLSHLEKFNSRIYVVLAIFMLTLNTVLCMLTKIPVALCGIIMVLLYGIISLIIYLIANTKIRSFRLESDASEEQSQSVIYTFKNHISIPYAVVNEQGKILTANSAFGSVLDINESLFNKDIDSLCGINFSELCDISDKRRSSTEESYSDPYSDILLKDVKRAEIAIIGGREFRMECQLLSSKGKTYYMVVFHDITELVTVTVRQKNEYTAVGYLAIDNLEEIAQYVKISYQDETRKVGKLLGEWVSEMGGVLREYENNKFILFFTQAMLSECIKNKFSILSEIHKIEIGDAHIPLTVSMGIAITEGSLEDREHDAMVSLDMALQRGGDQVVLKNPTGIYYFGAKTKTLQKRTRGHGKIIYAKLAALVESSSNVLIMGHRSPDFDSIGACIGMATLIRNMYSDMDVKIVMDKNSENFTACTQRLLALSEYKNMFVDSISALERNSSETLLIIVDANNMAILESPELAKYCFKKVIIDHHIKKEEFEEEPEFSYIDPSASSACELIAEIMEDVLPPETSFSEEANIMLSGIMLDTKNFTRTVGMRTFAAALYLKNCGADPEYSRTFFEEGFDDFLSASQFGSNAKIYKGCIAIASAVNPEGSNGRILAAKASDKLLAIKNVTAAFALILVNGDVHISARSNGSINVQLIAEQLGGGGHFDMAGAAVKESSLEDAEALLTQAIDKYFENLASENSGKSYENQE